jgi:hypothetical protein
MLIRVDTNHEEISTATSDSSSGVGTDPSMPPSDGTCHFMKLPTELRLIIAEDVYEDFFTQLTLGLYPPFFESSENELPDTQELFSVLHINRAFRLETLDLCIKLAKDSSEEVISRPPSKDMFRRMLPNSIRFGPHEQLKARHKKILKMIQQAKLSAGDARPGGDIPDDLLKAPNRRKSDQPGRRRETW